MRCWRSDWGFQHPTFPPRHWVHGAWVHGAIRYLRVSFPLVRHSRVGGNPVVARTPLDSRLRGNDLCTGFPPARERLVHWTPACAGTTCALDSRLRGNDLCTGLPPARERLANWSPACAGTTCVWLIAWLMGPSIYACRPILILLDF